MAASGLTTSLACLSEPFSIPGPAGTLSDFAVYVCVGLFRPVVTTAGRSQTSRGYGACKQKQECKGGRGNAAWLEKTGAALLFGIG